MKTLKLTITLLSLSLAFQISAQRKVSKIGITLIQVENTAPEFIQARQAVPPISLSSERSIIDFLSFGSEITFSKLDFTSTNTAFNRSLGTFRASIYGFSALGKAVIHIDVTRRIDVYGSGGLGYYYAFFQSNLSELTNSNIERSALSSYIGVPLNGLFSAFSLGSNLYIGDSFGFFTEVGFSQPLNNSRASHHELVPQFRLGIVFRS
jgi:hypothetical protein